MDVSRGYEELSIWYLLHYKILNKTLSGWMKIDREYCSYNNDICKLPLIVLLWIWIVTKYLLTHLFSCHSKTTAARNFVYMMWQSSIFNGLRESVMLCYVALKSDACLLWWHGERESQATPPGKLILVICIHNIVSWVTTRGESRMVWSDTPYH